MNSVKRTTPAYAGPGSVEMREVGKCAQLNYNPPRDFWKGFGGTQSMGPTIHRRPPNPVDTFWRPRRAVRS